MFLYPLIGRLLFLSDTEKPAINSVSKGRACEHRRHSLSDGRTAKVMADTVRADIFVRKYELVVGRTLQLFQCLRQRCVIENNRDSSVLRLNSRRDEEQAQQGQNDSCGLLSHKSLF